MFEVKKTSLLLSLLICIFAIGSWIDLNGVWVELPLLVNRLPEKWEIPTYIVAIVQIANVAPLLYMAITRCTKSPGNRRLIERCSIYLILLLGMVCTALLSKFWDQTVKIRLADSPTGEPNNHTASVAFLTLVCLLSVVDTTSSVTFLPYLAQYHRRFITALYVGEGLSGLLPGILGLIQGAGEEPTCINSTIITKNSTNKTNYYPVYPSPQFSISNFFVALCVILVCCFISFALVDNLKVFEQYKTTNGVLNSVTVKNRVSDIPGDGKILENSNSPHTYSTESGNSDLVHPYHLNSSLNHLLEIDSVKNNQASCYGPPNTSLSVMYIILIGYINLLTNGLLPSIQNYSLQPYSNSLYHTVITISQIINPIACLLTLRKWKFPHFVYLIMAAIASVCACYIIVLASLSPHPLLVNYGGNIIAALSWFVMGLIFSFLKTMLAIELQVKGHAWLQVCGASTQLGSAIGAIIGFLTVVVFKRFTAKQICG